MSAGEHRVVALIGLRCVGKSSVGKALARLTGARFVDLDAEILAEWLNDSASERDPAAAAAPRVADVLTQLGLADFRKLELKVLEQVLARSRDTPTVLATGGGCVETPGARTLLGEQAWCIWLHDDLERLIQRMGRDPGARPALTDLDPAAEFRQLAERRDPLYGALARVRVDSRGEGVGAVARRALHELPAGWSAPPPASG